MRLDVSAAAARLPRLLDGIARGEEILITRGGRPAARLIAANAIRRPRELGRLSGRVSVPDDFDAPLADHVLAKFEG